TERPPFQGESYLETLGQVLADDPVAPRVLRPAVPRDLQTICLKCLEKDPARRYASAAALRDDLQRFLEGQPIQARTIPLRVRAAKWVRRRPMHAAAVVLAGWLGLGLIGGIIYRDVLLQSHARALEREAARADDHQLEAKRRRREAVLLRYADQVTAA